MAQIRFDVDTGGIQKAAAWLAAVNGQLEYVSARALTSTVTSIHKRLKQRLPIAVESPTAWTNRGLLKKHASKTDLTAAVGFNYGDGSFVDMGRMSGMGVPSGRYMEVLARGGRRKPKATELALRRIGILKANEFLVPGGFGIGKPNKAGNITGGNYQLLLSRLGANRDIGVTSNAPKDGGSRGRTAKKKKEIDIFVDRRKGGAIMQRYGPKPKGVTGFGRAGSRGRPTTNSYQRKIRPAFFIVKEPTYRPIFPIKDIAERQFKAEIGKNFSDALTEALRSRR